MKKVYFNDEINTLVIRGYTEGYRRCVLLFQEDLFDNPQGIHGVNHMKRVLIHTLSLSFALQLSAEDTRVLSIASMYHDIGRTHDWEDETHGDDGWEKVKKLKLLEQEGISLDMEKPLTQEDKNAIEFLIRHHCRPDREVFGERLAQVEEGQRERVERLMKCFKDADGLDRVRLGDLDVRYMRLKESHERVDFAHELLKYFRELQKFEQPIEALDPKNITMSHMQVFKEQHMKAMRELDIEQIRSQPPSNRKVTLYHGTTTAHLGSILEKGILPRGQVGINNWEHVTHSLENFTYLTNKWHLFYAMNATMEHLIRLYGKEAYVHHLNESLPCYIEIRVPDNFLFVDEDAFLSNYMLKKAKTALKKGKDLDVNWVECLSQYGTVGVFGAIPPEWIVSFTVLGDGGMMDFILNDQKQYQKDFQQWQQGKGKGKLKLNDLLEQEQKSDFNGTWWMKDLVGKQVKGIIHNQETNKIAIQWTRKTNS